MAHQRQDQRGNGQDQEHLEDQKRVDGPGTAVVHDGPSALDAVVALCHVPTPLIEQVPPRGYCRATHIVL